jgi:hypothetical protein
MRVVDETEIDLRGLVQRDFGPIGPVLDDITLLNWLHYQARLIPQRRRTVILSPQIRARLNEFSAIRRIERALAGSGDVSPWLSDRVRLRKSDPLADMMFNDWQISHFHLGNVFVTPKKIGRSRKIPGDHLMFAYVAPDRAALLDVLPHGSWAMRDLLRILLGLIPESVPELKGIVGLQHNRTDEEILSLRRRGLNTPFEIDGRFFCSPGLGITGSFHATRLMRTLQHLRINDQRPHSATASYSPSVSGVNCDRPQ